MSVKPIHQFLSFIVKLCVEFFTNFEADVVGAGLQLRKIIRILNAKLFDIKVQQTMDDLFWVTTFFFEKV